MILSLDTETTGLWPWFTRARRARALAPDSPFAISVCRDNGETDFIRLDVDPKTRRVTVPRSARSKVFHYQDIVEDERNTVILHNAPFDILQTTNLLGWEWKAKLEATDALHRVLRPTAPSHHLKGLAWTYGGIPDSDQKILQRSVVSARHRAKSKGWSIATKETHGNKPAFADYWLAPPDLLEKYSREDAFRTMFLWQLFQEKLKEKPNLRDIYYQVEIPVIKATIRMTAFGVNYHRKAALKLIPFYDEIRGEWREEISKAGIHSPSSPPELKRYFIEKKGYPVTSKTKKGNDSADGTQLLIWANDFQDPTARAIVEWRAANKAIKELENYEKFCCPNDDGTHTVHPGWKPQGTKTMRFACSDPNLMQMTNVFSGRKRASIETRQRECWGPAPGRWWLDSDYSQIEVWLFAFESRDPEMMKSLVEGEDFHQSTAFKAFGARKDYKGNEYAWRRRAKLIFFSKLYGGGVRKISNLINCSYNEAKTFVQEFETRLPRVEAYMEDLEAKVAANGYCLTNLFGREYEMDPRKLYRSVNYNIQGSAADVMKRALIKTDAHLRYAWPEARAIATIHDELIVDAPLKYLCKRFIREVQQMMQKDYRRCHLPIPFPVKSNVVRTHLLKGQTIKL